MTDEILLVVFGIIGVCVLIIVMMRNGDYEEQRILPPGRYEVGVDIRPGRCDLMAESGGGDFIIRNKNADGWSLGNSIGATSGIMPSRFRNVTLMQGDILEINGNVKVLLTPPVPIADLNTETLGPGIYRFGVDVPPAKYDFEAASGSGEIIMVDIHDNSFSIFQDMAAGHPQRAKSFNNVLCSMRYELWVNGSLQIKLKRSKHQPLLIGRQKIQ